MRTAITLVLLAAALVWARSRTDAFGVFFAIHASSALFYLFGMARFGALSPGSGDDSTAADRSLLLKALLYGTFINVGNNVVTLLAPYRETELGITLGQRIALAALLLAAWASLVMLVKRSVERSRP